MHTFTAVLEKFTDKGEKTGWTYVGVPASITDALKPGRRTTFRVKGTLDQYVFQRVALVPMGDGQFIMAINATMRRGIRKEVGNTVLVAIESDDAEFPLSADLMNCLTDEPAALAFFGQLSPGHQRYYSNWIEEARTIETRTSRIAKAITGLALGMDYGAMIRYFKKLNE